MLCPLPTTENTDTTCCVPTGAYWKGIDSKAGQGCHTPMPVCAGLAHARADGNAFLCASLLAFPFDRARQKRLLDARQTASVCRTRRAYSSISRLNWFQRKQLADVDDDHKTALICARPFALRPLRIYGNAAQQPAERLASASQPETAQDGTGHEFQYRLHRFRPQIHIVDRAEIKNKGRFTPDGDAEGHW